MGPMAKQHRMAVLTLGCFGSIVEAWLGVKEIHSLKIALTIIFIGVIITCWRRLNLTVPQLHAKPKV